MEVTEAFNSSEWVTWCCLRARHLLIDPVAKKAHEMSMEDRLKASIKKTTGKKSGYKL